MTTAMGRCSLGLYCLIGMSLWACTSWYEIHGPTVGLGIEMNGDGLYSPRIELGYGYDRYKPAMGYGFSATAAYSPLLERFDLRADAHGNMLLNASVGAVYRLDLDGARVWGVQVGTRNFFGYPPAACVPPWFEGEFEGCPDDEYFQADTLYPAWLPRWNVVATFYPGHETEACAPDQGSCFDFSLSASLEAVISSYYLLHGERRPTHRTPNPYPESDDTQR
ncbi:MAG: hypothetical protein JW797_04180 [Bradymonadales bacterium]|nr:hypothetical protein [Bradymonadales bacterium]